MISVINIGQWLEPKLFSLISQIYLNTVAGNKQLCSEHIANQKTEDSFPSAGSMSHAKVRRKNPNIDFHQLKAKIKRKYQHFNFPTGGSMSPPKIRRKYQNFIFRQEEFFRHQKSEEVF